MRRFGIFAAALAITGGLSIVTPAVGQSTNFLETQNELERRRQAEQYNYQKEQEQRGNILNTDKPRGLGEASPRSPSTHPTVNPDHNNPNRPR